MDTGSWLYHGAGLQNRVIDTTFPIPVVLRLDLSILVVLSVWAVLLNRSDDQEDRSYLSGIPSRSAAPS